MNSYKTMTFAQHFFCDLGEDEYLNEIYENLLFNYSIKMLDISDQTPREIIKGHALRFADLLSKSTGVKKSENHKVWAQEIMILMDYLYPDDKEVDYVMGSVFSNTGNYWAQGDAQPGFVDVPVMDRLFTETNKSYLSVPGDMEGRMFFPAQKRMFDKFEHLRFSYSAPTSMGKTMMITTFIKSKINNGDTSNYVLLVPSRALINENSTSLIMDMGELLEKKDYRVVTSMRSHALDAEHHYVFVFTPERLTTLLMNRRDIRIDYIFVDEAQRLSISDGRAPYYYNVLAQLERQHYQAHIVFSSPNVPNPELYLSAAAKRGHDVEREYSSFSPVSQFKFLIDSDEKNIYSCNTRKESFIKLGSLPELGDPIEFIERVCIRDQNIIYCGGPDRTVKTAQELYDYLTVKDKDELSDPYLDKLADDIGAEIHTEFSLAKFVRCGIAYHIGYLPLDIKARIEEGFRERKIRFLFCTSTLLEGVNLPADHLHIISPYNGQSYMDKISFHNLMGRVGRVGYHLSGNIFVHAKKNNVKHFRSFMTSKVEPMALSVNDVVRKLDDETKQKIIEKIVDENLVLEKPKGLNDNEFQALKKYILILEADIVHERSSVIHDAFSDFITPETEQTIRDHFSEKESKPGDDITLFTDQRSSLSEAVQEGLRYPEKKEDGNYNKEEVKEFIYKIASIFKWDVHEKRLLGEREPSGRYPLLDYYARLLPVWMEGKPLRAMFNASSTFMIREYKMNPYRNDKPTIESIVRNTFDTVERAIRFNLSSCFQKFTEEVKLQDPEDSSIESNDWHIYTEYGANDPRMILLQRMDYSRGSAKHIVEHADEYIVTTGENIIILSESALDECEFGSISKETESIKLNYPECFK